MAEPIDDAVLSWEPLRESDLDELGDLIQVIEYVDDTISRHSYEQVVEAFEAAGGDATRNAIIGRERGGSIVAFGWNQVQSGDRGIRRVLITGGVHPAFRDQHIGAALLDWQIRRAREWYAETYKPGFGPLKLIASADEHLHGPRDLYESVGLRAETWFYDLHHVFDPDEVVPEPALPSGFRLVAYPTCDPEAVRAAHNRAFADKPGARAVSAAAWEESLLRPEARPDLSWVVLDPSGGVAGYALNSVVAQDPTEGGPTEGWTDRLGVLPEHRHRGIASALLLASNRGFRSVGCAGAGLGYDTTDASFSPELFVRHGYEAVEIVVAHSLTIAG